MYIDTDSVDGKSEIYINGEVTKIEEAYNNFCNSYNAENSRKLIHNVSDCDIYTKSVKDDKIVDDQILRIIKHETTKEMFEISIENKKVVVTEDHSIIVERGGELLSISPKNIKEDDILLYLEG